MLSDRSHAEIRALIEEFEGAIRVAIRDEGIATREALATKHPDLLRSLSLLYRAHRALFGTFYRKCSVCKKSV